MLYLRFLVTAAIFGTGALTAFEALAQACPNGYCPCPSNLVLIDGYCQCPAGTQFIDGVCQAV